MRVFQELMAQNDDKPDWQTNKPPAPPPSLPVPPLRPLPPPVSDLEQLNQKLAETEKLLATEREKVLRHDLRTEQEAAFSSKVEASLKDIQQKLQRDKRERELDEERSELKQKLHELESKLISERETWVQVMKSQLGAAAPQAQPQQPAQPIVENVFATKLEELGAKWERERRQLEQEAQQRVKAAESASEERVRSLEQKLQDSSRMTDRLSEMERKLDSLRSGPQNPAPELRQLEERLRQARMSEAMLRHQLAAKMPPPPSQPSQAQTALEQRIAELAREKQALAADLSAVKDTLSRLEKQGTSLDQISQVILAFKEVIAQALARPNTAGGGNIVEEVLTRERKLDQAQAEINALKAKQDGFENLLRNKEELIIKAQTERDERVSRAEDERLKAITELVALKKMVSRLKPINAALEREYARAQAENLRAKEDLSRQAKEIEKLAETNVRFKTDMTDMGARLDEKARRANYLETELSRIQSENEKRVQELEGILKEQSEKYAVHLEGLESERAEREKKLSELDTQKARLEREYKVRVNERDLLKSGLDSTVKDRQQLRENLDKMQQERTSLSGLVQSSVRQVQALNRQKEAVDLMLKSLQTELSRNTKEIRTLNQSVQALKDRNKSLEDELQAREEELARNREAVRQARRDSEKLKDLLERETASSEKLKRRIEYYEKMAHNVLHRFKWAVSGRKPE